jgi:hypothetical protein
MSYSCKHRQRAAGRKSWHTRKKTQPWLVMLSAARRRAAGRNEECELDREWFESRWTGRCELTGMEFGIEHMAASVDRLDHTKGYTKANCRIVLFCINALRGQMTDQQMREVARRLLND